MLFSRRSTYGSISVKLSFAIFLATCMDQLCGTALPGTPSCRPLYGKRIRQAGSCSVIIHLVQVLPFDGEVAGDRLRYGVSHKTSGQSRASVLLSGVPGA